VSYHSSVWETGSSRPSGGAYSACGMFKGAGISACEIPRQRYRLPRSDFRLQRRGVRPEDGRWPNSPVVDCVRPKSEGAHNCPINMDLANVITQLRPEARRFGSRRPPSSWLSVRMKKRTYFTATTKMRAQNRRERTPQDCHFLSCAASGPYWFPKSVNGAGTNIAKDNSERADH
jgi:hypothetical protein